VHWKPHDLADDRHRQVQVDRLVKRVLRIVDFPLNFCELRREIFRQEPQNQPRPRITVRIKRVTKSRNLFSFAPMRD
jgi:hypothetical protein